MTKKIIIVEDDRKNLKLFRDILKLLPEVEILSATSGDEGFKLINNNDPDLILLDIQLPNMSGIEICERLREIERFQSKKIIAITALAMKGDRERIMSAGFNEYISKPINLAYFRAIVKELLNIT